MALVGVVLLLALILGLGLVPACMAFSRKVGALDYPRVGQFVGMPIPRLGGLVVWGGSLLGITLAWLFSPQVSLLLSPLAHKLTGFALGGTAILLVGVVDDIRGLRARWKLLAQVAVAGFIYWWGLRVEVVTNIFDPAHPFHLGLLGLPLNVVWMILAINAMNLIDGLDGLAGGVFGLALVLLLSAGLMSDQLPLSLVAAALLGATAAFLRHNYFSGAIYLGDSGSTFMGYCLAAFVPLYMPKSAGFAAALIPVAVLSVPIAEVVVTTMRRFWLGRPVGKPDDGHAHYRMLKNGMGERQVTLFIQGISLFCGLLALGMTFVFNENLAILMGLIWLALLALFLKVGYFSRGARRSTCQVPYRFPIFLEAERLVEKRIWQIGQAADARELENGLAGLARTLGLYSLHLVLRREGEGVVFQAGWQDEEGDQTEHEAVVSLHRHTSQGLAAELELRLGRTVQERFGHGLLKWMERVTDEAAHAAAGHLARFAAADHQHQGHA